MLSKHSIAIPGTLCVIHGTIEDDSSILINAKALSKKLSVLYSEMDNCHSLDRRAVGYF